MSEKGNLLDDVIINSWKTARIAIFLLIRNIFFQKKLKFKIIIITFFNKCNCFFFLGKKKVLFAIGVILYFGAKFTEFDYEMRFVRWKTFPLFFGIAVFSVKENSKKKRRKIQRISFLGNIFQTCYGKYVTLRF